VNEAIIFRHFATKRELYAAIMDRKACAAEVQAIQQTLAEAIHTKDDHKVFFSLGFHLLEAHERDDARSACYFTARSKGTNLPR
jgi:AcrR family transcriptional regulator